MSVALTANTTGFVGPMTRAATVAKVFGAGVVIALALSMAQAVKFESAMAGVAKTVQASASEMAGLERGIVSMANRMPASREEIAGVAEAAGQLGISKQHLLDFTEVAVNLGVTTNLAADDAATGLAKVANVMGTSETDFDRMGATLVELGNNGASTESDILAMAQRLSGIGHLIGASEADVFGLANALSSMGVEAELGGGVMTRVLQMIYTSVEQGGPALEKFASVAGMSAEQFAAAWQKDPVQAFSAIVGGLTRVKESGGDVVSTLDQLGIKGTHNRQVVLQLLGAQDLLTESLSDGRRAWEENSALTEEAEKRYDTVASRLEVLRNQVTNIGRVIGASLIPYLARGIDGLESFGAAIERVAQQRLAFAWEQMVRTGHSLAAVLGMMVSSAKPLAVAFAALGGLVLVKALALTATGLANVAGWLEKNQWAVSILTGLVTVLAGRAVLGSLASALGTIIFNLANVTMAAAGAAASLSLLTVGVMAAVVPLALYGSAITNAQRQAKQWRGEVEKKIDPTNMSTYSDAIDEANRKQAESLQYLNDIGAKGGGFWGRAKAEVVATTQILTPLKNQVNDSAVAMDEAAKAERHFRLEKTATSAMLQAYADELGITVPQVVRLMKDLDLENTGKDWTRNVDAMRGNLHDLASDAGYAGDQIAGAMLQGEDALQDQAEAWEELEKQIRDSWGSSTDLVGGFSGRQTVDEIQGEVDRMAAGIEDSVRDMRASLADSLADIDDSLVDTVSDIRDGLADTNADVGKSLGKSLDDINDDLADSVADIQDEMNEARATLTGDELADAIASGQDRLSEAYEDAAERRADAQESAGERTADAAEDASDREADAREDAEDRKAKAAEEAAERIKAAEEEGAAAISKYWAENGVTGAQIEDFYREQTGKSEQFAKDLQTAFEQGYDPALLARLLEAGPEESAPVVQALVQGHSDALVEIVNEGEKKIREMTEQAVEMARIADTAIRSDDGRLSGWVDEAQAIVMAVNQLGGSATLPELRYALPGMTGAEIAEIAKAFGLVGVEMGQLEGVDLRSQAENLDGLRRSLNEIVDSDPTITPQLDSDVVTNKVEILEGLLEEYAESDPEARAFLETHDADERRWILTAWIEGWKRERATAHVGVLVDEAQVAVANAVIDSLTRDRTIKIGADLGFDPSGNPVTGPFAGILPGLLGFSSGGLVPGVDRGYDSVPAKVRPQEFVTRKDMVSKWGVGSMHALNSGRVPAGWSIPGHTRADTWRAQHRPLGTGHAGYHLTPQQAAVQVDFGPVVGGLERIEASVDSMRRAFISGAATKNVHLHGPTPAAQMRDMDRRLGNELTSA